MVDWARWYAEVSTDWAGYALAAAVAVGALLGLLFSMLRQGVEVIEE